VPLNKRIKKIIRFILKDSIPAIKIKFFATALGCEHKGAVEVIFPSSVRGQERKIRVAPAQKLE
jgi:hypothetical protein